MVKPVLVAEGVGAPRGGETVAEVVFEAPPGDHLLRGIAEVAASCDPRAREAAIVPARNSLLKSTSRYRAPPFLFNCIFATPSRWCVRYSTIVYELTSEYCNYVLHCS